MALSMALTLALTLALMALVVSCSPPPPKQTRELPSELPPPPNATQLSVTESRLSLSLSEANPDVFEARVDLALSWPSGAASSGYLNVSVPKALKGEVRVSSPCALVTNEGGAAQLTCERVSGEELTRVQVGAQGVWSEVSGHHALHEGERTYRLLSLSPSAWSEIFLGVDARRRVPRTLELSAPRGRVSLARLGRDEGEVTLGGDDPSAPVTQTWARQGELTEPLLVAFGDWEEPLKVALSGGRVASLLTPAGTSFYRLGAQSFKEKQAALLQDAERQVSALLGGPQLGDVWLISLPPHVDGDLPALQRWGVLQVDEAWFHRHALSPGAQRPRERARLLRELALALAPLELGPWSAGALEWVALRLVWASLSDRERALSQQLYAIQHTRSLDEPDASRPMSPSRALDLIEMAYGWRAAPPEGATAAPLADPLPLAPLARAALESDEAVIATLQTLAPELRDALSSLMRAPRAPHLEVSYAPRAGDPLTLELTVRSAPPLTPLGESAEAPVSLPVLPVCVRVGLEGGGVSERCLRGATPDAEGRARLSLTLPRPARWLHPNAHQRGFYTWSLSGERLKPLLSAEDISEVEWGALPEVMFQLMSAGAASPTQYLDTLNALAMREFTPATLSLLFTHLNRAVHYLGALGARDDSVRRWAASLLRGVMASEPRFGAPPFSDITQLQLAEWESPDPKALSADARKRLRALLADQSADGEMSAGRGPSDQELEALQYPLMLWVRVGEEGLWERVSRKFAQSDDQPLLRLLTLQALGAFSGAELLKTLTLFEGGEPSEEPDEAHGEGEPLEVLEALEADRADRPQESTPAATQEPEQEPEGEDEGEGAEGELTASLKEDEALSLARSIRTTEERRAAWRWLVGQMRAGKGAELVGFYSVDVQRAFLRWGAALCDEEGVKSLERALSAESGFSPMAHPEARRSIRQARRCVSLRPLAPQAEAWVSGL